jgi:cardiolipin synthase
MASPENAAILADQSTGGASPAGASRGSRSCTLEEPMVSRPKYLRGWVKGILAGIVATALFLMVAQDQETLTIESPLSATDARFVDYVASLTGAPVEQGDRYTVLRNGEQAFPAMLEAIRSARRRIVFESFVYQDGIVGDQFTHELSSAAERRVDVRIVLDAYGSTLSDQSTDRLKTAGAHVVWFNTLRPWSLEEANYRTHRRVLSVDGRIGFTGGLGLADQWRGDAERAGGWRDTHFKVEGPAVRGLEAAFYENWLEAGGRVAPALDTEQPPQQTGARTVVIWSNPTGGTGRVKLLFLLSIAGARRQIDIQSPYFVLDESTRWSLDQARRRGVRVRVLTEGNETDAPPVRDASRSEYQSLLDRGYELYEYQPAMMHVKAMMVDGTWSVIGSANFDNRSLELNDELILGIQDPGLAAQLGQDFEADLKKSIRIDAKTWPDRSLWQKTREQFWGLFGEVF